MTKRASQISQLLKEMATGSMPVFTAVVTSPVDEDNLTIDIEPIGQAELDEVRLKAGIDGIKDGIVEYPKQGSTVLCGIIGNDEDICFVIKCSEVDKVVVNGGLQGGLINIATLVQELAKATARIDKIIEAINGGIPGAADGGTALLASIKAILETMGDTEDFTEIEDTKVTH